jgi:hypothetical protein
MNFNKLYSNKLPSKDINIVYFIWINENRDWKEIITGQINDIKNCGILYKSKLHIVLCANNNYYINQSLNVIFNLLSNIDYLTLDINTFLENKYEYEGIKKLYDLANLYPDKYYLYLHSKGMFNTSVNNSNTKSSRFIDEIILTNGILNRWNEILSIFKNNKDIMRIGMFPSDGGWVWFNFFWTRGDYLRTCEEPRITNDRYYYESWLCNSVMREFDSYSLYSNKIQKYSGTDAGNFLINLRQKYI